MRININSIALRKLFPITLLLFLFLISFYLGVVYEKNSRHRQEILMFANITGDQVLEITDLLEMSKTSNSDSVLLDYYSSMAAVIGCSTWFKYLDTFDLNDLTSFLAGVELIVGSAKDNDESKCVYNLRHFYSLNTSRNNE